MLREESIKLLPEAKKEVTVEYIEEALLVLLANAAEGQGDMVYGEGS